MLLKELLAGAPPSRVVGRDDILVSGLCHDSRALSKGDVFFALSGAKTDGNRHVKEAISKGACAIVSELEAPPPPFALELCWIQVENALVAMGRAADLFFSRPSQSMTIVGVTGTNGKTTTTYFLESIFKACGKIPGVIGTVDYRLDGRPLEKASNTTPLALELQRLLARFRDGGASHVAMEVSSHALSLKRVDEIDFDAAVFTNLSRDHLDFHRTEDEYFEAKAGLFDLLGRAASSKKRRSAILNADDPRSAELRHRIVGADIVTFGLSAAAAMRAEGVVPEEEGTRFELIFPSGKKRTARIKLVGLHNVLNALAAAATAWALNLGEEGILQGLWALSLVPGRLEPVPTTLGFKIFVDYAHTEAALRSVLEHLGNIPHRNIITVFGCGGERDGGKRGPMGQAACALSDSVFITSDNPRGEDPLKIIAEIQAPLKTAGLKNYKIEPDRGEAIAAAVRMAEPGDILLIAGKGHEDYQILKDKTVHFDDREAARSAVEKRQREN
jgi:UDP-N-acetylmuramoyl-L-alanyl-D-glutamate--2,6-diaminopimelate ligase